MKKLAIFRPISGYILETVQERLKSINQSINHFIYQKQSYQGTLIGSLMFSVEPCHLLSDLERLFQPSEQLSRKNVARIPTKRF